jgi:hypothetical protein
MCTHTCTHTLFNYQNYISAMEEQKWLITF